METLTTPNSPKTPVPDSRQAWLRLAATMLVSTIGGVGMWSVVVALPAVQAEFAVPRAQASLPFTLAMLGFALGGVVMGRLLDAFGILAPLAVGALALSLGYLGAASAGSLVVFALAHAVIGFGSSVTFGPLMADISYWFVRRRGVAVTLCSAGNYIAGTVWPPVVQHAIALYGWRATHVAIGMSCGAAMLLIGFVALRRKAPAGLVNAGAATRTASPANLGLSPARCKPAGAGLGLLLRGDVDAAGSHRRLLRRSRLRRRPRRRHAGVDDGVRHRRPHRFGIYRRPRRRLAHADAGVGAAGRRAIALSFL